MPDVLCAVMDACDRYRVDPATVRRVAESYARHPVGCYPANRVIARQLGLSIRQLQRARQALREARVLEGL